MRRFVLVVLAVSLLSVSGWGQIHLTSSDEITISGRSLDSSGFYCTPDSVRIVVYRDGVEEHDAWYNSADAQCAAINDMLVFTDAFGDIDDDAGNGLYEVMAGFFEDSGDLYNWKTMWVCLGVDLGNLAAIETKVDSCLDSLQAQDDWVGNVRYCHSDSILSLRGLHIRGTISGDTAFIARGNGSGYGMLAFGGSTGHGFSIRGGTTSGNGLTCYTDNGIGFSIRGSGSSAGIYCTADGTGPGAIFQGGDDDQAGSAASGMRIVGRRHDGLYIQGGDSANMHGIEVQGGTGNNNDAIRIVASSQDAMGVRITSASGEGFSVTGGGADPGIEIVGGATGAAIVIEGGSTSGHGVAITSSDTGLLVAGTDADIVADITGNLLGYADSVLKVDTVLKGVSATASVDSADVARAVWNTPQTNHVTNGTFGKFLDTEISGIASGSGAYSITIVAFDSSLGQVVSNVNLGVRNIDQSSLIAVGTTDASGKATMNLDADSFVVVAVAPGYVFEPYDTVVVAGGGTDTLFGCRFDPGSPASPSLCRVYGYLYTVEGKAEQGAVVSACLPKGVSRSGGLIVSPFSVSTKTDSAGYFYLDLIPSDSLAGSDATYEIGVNRADGSILRKRMTIPAAATWQLEW